MFGEESLSAAPMWFRAYEQTLYERFGKLKTDRTDANVVIQDAMGHKSQKSQ